MKFTKEECQIIINYSKFLDKSISLTYVKEKNRYNEMLSNRQFYDVWYINYNDKTKWIFDRIFEFVENNLECKVKNKFTSIALHKFEVGNSLKKHKDPNMYYNVGVCLNENYEGGEFLFYNPNSKLEKEEGKIYTFKGSILHKIKEITSGERWSILGLFGLGDLEFKKKLL